MASDQRYIKPEALEKLRATIVKLFAEGQFHEVGMRAICTQAKVSPQTVYKYFGNKDQLLLACMENNLQELVSVCVAASKDEPDTFKALEKFSNALFNYYSENAFIARIIYLNIPTVYWTTQSSPAREALAQELAKLILKGQQENRIKHTGSLDLVVDIITGAGNRIITRWLAEGEQKNLIAIGKQSMDMLFEGMRKD